MDEDGYTKLDERYRCLQPTSKQKTPNENFSPMGNETLLRDILQNTRKKSIFWDVEAEFIKIFTSFRQNTLTSSDEANKCFLRTYDVV